MANELKNYVLVSATVPAGFWVLDASGEHGLAESKTNRVIPDWDYRVYEVPESGSFEGVDIQPGDRFVAQIQGHSLTELDSYSEDSGMIGDIRSWGSNYRIITPDGDFVDLPEEDRVFNTFPPQTFGLASFPIWENDAELGEDLTDMVFED